MGAFLATVIITTIVRISARFACGFFSVRLGFVASISFLCARGVIMW